MHAVELGFAFGWAAFWIYWLVAAVPMKRGGVPWSRELGIRAAIVVVVFVLVRLGAFRGGGLNSDPWRAGIGLVVFAAGLSSAELLQPVVVGHGQPHRQHFQRTPRRRGRVVV
jgi:hypothetical protein